MLTTAAEAFWAARRRLPGGGNPAGALAATLGFSATATVVISLGFCCNQCGLSVRMTKYAANKTVTDCEKISQRRFMGWQFRRCRRHVAQIVGGALPCDGIGVHCGCMPSFDFILYIHAQAPVKPLRSAPCNGCGICCLAQPCPLGAVLSRRLTGACKALVWSEDSSRYICGAVRRPFTWFVKRWIGADQGCDCDLQDPRSTSENTAP